MAEVLADKDFDLVDVKVAGVQMRERLTQRWTISASQSAGDDLVTHPLPIPVNRDMTLYFVEESGTLDSDNLDVSLQVSEDGATWVTVKGDTDAVGANLDIQSTPAVAVFDYDDDAMSAVGKYVRFSIDLEDNQTGAAVVKLVINQHIS